MSAPFDTDLAGAEAAIAEAEAIGFENLTSLQELRARLGLDTGGLCRDCGYMSSEWGCRCSYFEEMRNE